MNLSCFRQLSSQILIIALVGFIVFFNVLDNEFVWDDELQIVQNQIIHEMTAGNFLDAFLGSTMGAGGREEQAGVYYKPMMSISYGLLWSIGEGSPFPFHLFQLILGILNAVLVLVLFRRHLPEVVAFVGALVFLVHPFNSEVIQYIADLQDTLYLFFGLMAWFSATRESMVYLVLSFLFMLASLFAKESGLLLILFLVAYMALFWRSRLLVTVGLSGVALGIYLYVRLQLAGLDGVYPNHVPIAYASPLERLMTVPLVMWFYVKNFFFPYPLHTSQHWVITELSLTRVVLPAAGILTLMLAVLWRCRRERELILYSVIMALCFGLHIHIIPLDWTVTNRWFYFGSIGAIGYILHLTQNYRWTPVIGGVIVVVFSVMTMIRNEVFQDGYTLYGTDINYSTDSYELHNNWGVELFRKQEIDRGCDHFRRSVELAPFWDINHVNWGVCLMRRGRLQEAEQMLLRSLENGNSHLSYSNYLILLYQQKRMVEFRQVLGTALKHYPRNVEFIRYRQQLGAQ